MELYKSRKKKLFVVLVFEDWLQNKITRSHRIVYLFHLSSFKRKIEQYKLLNHEGLQQEKINQIAYNLSIDTDFEKAKKKLNNGQQGLIHFYFLANIM